MRKYIILVAIILFFIASEQRVPPTTQPININNTTFLVIEPTQLPPENIASIKIVNEYNNFTNFLLINNISEHVYDDDVNKKNIDRYVCSHFTRDLMIAAKKEGYKIYAVRLTGTTTPGVYWWHSIAVVKLDNMWYFVEPQTDEIIKISNAYKRYKYEYAYIGKKIQFDTDESDIIDIVRHEPGLIDGDFIYLRGFYE